MIPVALGVVILFNFALTFLLLNAYGNIAKHNTLVTTSVFIAWFFSFNIIFILPLDITSTIYGQCVASANSVTPAIINGTVLLDFQPSFGNETNSSTTTTTTSSTISPPIVTTTESPNITAVCEQPWSYVPPAILLTLWQFMYWSLQFLTWILLPLFQSYSMSGEFTVLGRVRSSLNENIRYYIVFGVLFAIFLIFYASKEHFTFEGLKVFCISASNTFGLFLLIILMGYGLVEIPRNFLLNYYRHYDYKLKYLYFKVAKFNAEMRDAEADLEELYVQLRLLYWYAKQKNDIFVPQCEHIVAKLPDEIRTNLLNTRSISGSSGNDPDLESKLNLKSLAALNARIKKAIQTDHRTRLQYQMLVERALELRDLIELETKIYSYSPETNGSSLEKWICRRIPSAQRLFARKQQFSRLFYAFVGYFCAGVSVLIVFSEFTFFIQSAPISVPALIVHLLEYRYIWIELFSTFSIAYLCICAYYTVFKVRIFNYYYLAKHRQTDEYSLIFCAMLLCRLASPLCLNFLGLIHLDSHITKQSISQETAFTQIMGHMDTVSFISDHLSIYLPVAMSVFCVATFFKLGTRIVHYFGIEQFQLDDEDTKELVKQGNDFTTRHVQKRNRQTQHQTSSGTSGGGSAALNSRFTSQDQLINKPMPGGGVSGGASSALTSNQATTFGRNNPNPTSYGINFFDE